MIAEVSERLAVSKYRMKRFNMESFSLMELNEVEG
jgi:hypothetical protein